MNASDILRFGQLSLSAAVEGLTVDDWDRPGACGAWSVRDVVAHLASYEAVVVDILAGFLEAAPTPALDRFLREADGFNDAEIARRSAHPSASIWEDLGRAHARTLDLIGRIPVEARRQPGTLPWYGTDYALDDLLVYMVYGHKREHAAQIAGVRDRRGP